MSARNARHKAIKEALIEDLRYKSSWKTSEGQREIKIYRSGIVDILETTRRRDKEVLHDIYEIKTSQREVDRGIGQLLRYRINFVFKKKKPVGAFLVLPYDVYLKYREKNKLFEYMLTELGIGLLIFKNGRFKLAVPATEYIEEKIKLNKSTIEFLQESKRRLRPQNEGR